MTNILVIDTNKYSGNFERSLYKFLFAYEHDDVYDCENMVDKYSHEPVLKKWYEENYNEYVFDYQDGKQPVGIWVSPNYVNNGLGLHLHKDDPKIRRWKRKWPAYMSVAICFSGEIPDNIKVLIKDRIQRFVDENIEEGLIIENIKIVKIETVNKTEHVF